MQYTVSQIAGSVEAGAQHIQGSSGGEGSGGLRGFKEGRRTRVSLGGPGDRRCKGDWAASREASLALCNKEARGEVVQRKDADRGQAGGERPTKEELWLARGRRCRHD